MTHRKPLRKKKNFVRIIFVVIQIAFIAIACATDNIIILESSWPKEYTEEYIRWWFEVYEAKSWHWSINLFVILSSIVLAIAIGVLSERAHKRGELSIKQICFCFFATGLLRALAHYILCTTFKHYYQYFSLLDPESLCIALLLLSELRNKTNLEIERSQNEETKESYRCD